MPKLKNQNLSKPIHSTWSSNQILYLYHISRLFPNSQTIPLCEVTQHSSSIELKTIIYILISNTYNLLLWYQLWQPENPGAWILTSPHKPIFKHFWKPVFFFQKIIKSESLKLESHNKRISREHLNFNKWFEREHLNPLKATGSHSGYSIEIRINHY